MPTTKKSLKEQIEQRIKKAICAIAARSGGKARLDLSKALGLVAQAFAHNNTGAGKLPISCMGDRVYRPLTPAIVLRDVGKTIRLYYVLVRTDKAIGLTAALERIEGYAKHGLVKLQVLGEPDTGYYLYDPDQQTDADAQVTAERLVESAPKDPFQGKKA